jgi:hypothetical protein
MADHRKYKYDVAFSFLTPDEPLALRFAAALKPLKCFVFSHQQAELAGTDALESFRVVFREESRLNVIIFRAGWGAGGITRIEETGIEERIRVDGWDSVLVLRQDQSPKRTWMPDIRIYFDLATYPFDQSVGAIKRQAERFGASPRPLTGLETAQRNAEAAEYERASREFIGSVRGVQAADAAVSAILDAIEDGIRQIGLTVPRWSPFFGRGPMYSGLLHSVGRLGRCSVGINWQRYENSLSDSKFTATVFDGHLPFNRDSPAEKMYGYGRTPKKLTELSFKSGRCPGLDIAWQDGAGQWIDAEEVAGRILESLTKFAGQLDAGK